MSFDSQTLENLLHQPEGPALDFKVAQYRFGNANDTEKSELLKDILALANSWRLTTAYILIGVQETKGGRSKVLGVKDHLDDAILHQFVNSKTQRPLQFSHQQFFAEGVEIDVIQIPVQDRPIFLTKRFGKLQADEVKVRDGSSTRNATPDEIAKMGADQVLSDVPQPAQEWTSERIILSIEKSISNIIEIKENDKTGTPEFREWHRATLYMIKSAFGDRTLHYGDFRNVIDEMHPTKLFGPFGVRMITGSWRGILDRKLDEAVNVLASFKDEVERYGYNGTGDSNKRS